MFISEVFHSIQGEGLLAGVPSVFIRTSGCNLRCRFCDTPHTSWHAEGTHQSIDDLIRQVSAYPSKHVVITGGEPMIAPEIEHLCQRLNENGLHITIETAATVFKPVVADLISLSPKLRNSIPVEDVTWAEKHDKLRIQPEVIRSFVNRFPTQFKFVMEKPEDLREVQSILSEIPYDHPDKVFLMPEGTSTSVLREKGLWIAELCKKHGYRYGPRLHIDLWGHVRGT